MADVVVVQVGDGRKYLAHDHGSLSLRQKLFLDNQIKQLTSIAHLHSYKHTLLIKNIPELLEIYLFVYTVTFLFI